MRLPTSRFWKPGGNANNIQSYTQDSAQHRYYNRYQIGEPYIQDDWKVNRRLTVNLGVRFSLFGLYYEKYRAAYNWDPSAYSPAVAAQISVNPTTGQLTDVASGNPIPLDPSNPDPRILNGLVRCGTQGAPRGCMKNITCSIPRLAWASPWILSAPARPQFAVATVCSLSMERAKRRTPALSRQVLQTFST